MVDNLFWMDLPFVMVVEIDLGIFTKKMHLMWTFPVIFFKRRTLLHTMLWSNDLDNLLSKRMGVNVLFLIGQHGFFTFCIHTLVERFGTFLYHAKEQIVTDCNTNPVANPVFKHHWRIILYLPCTVL